MSTIPPQGRGDNNAQRRSQRVMLKVSVVVLVHGADNKVVSEVTRTVTVNAHGASVMLTDDLERIRVLELICCGHSISQKKQVNT